MPRWEEVIVVVLVIAILASIALAIKAHSEDINSGTVKLIMAQVVDKKHTVCSEPTVSLNMEGELETTLHDVDYWYVYFLRKDGVKINRSTSKQFYDSVKMGDQFVIRLIIGGKTGGEFMQGMEPYRGAEVQ